MARNMDISGTETLYRKGVMTSGQSDEAELYLVRCKYISAS